MCEQNVRNLVDDLSMEMHSNCMSEQFDYRQILKRSLESKRAQNASYSLRAFARDLSLSVSFLSEVLHRKRNLSVVLAKQVAQKLNLSDREQELFQDLVSAESGRSELLRDVAKAKLKLKYRKHNIISEQEFRVIADWYHFAILELTKLHSFRSSSKWIAKKLGISEDEAKAAIKRLKQMHLIKIEKGKLIACNEKDVTNFDIPAQGVRIYHQQLLSKAKQALEGIPVEEREFSSSLITIQKDRLPEMKARIRAFRRELCAEFEVNDKPNDLYTLSVQFFSVLNQNGEE